MDGYSYQTNGNSGTYYCIRCGQVAVYSPSSHDAWHAAQEANTPTEDELRDAIDHIQGSVDFQDVINPEAIRVLISTATSCCVSTPTDDEREALSEFLFTVYDHGTQPNALKEADAILSFLRHRTVQGEPSDAAVEAAAEAIMRERGESNWVKPYLPLARAALRAAAAAERGQ